MLCASFSLRQPALSVPPRQASQLSGSLPPSSVGTWDLSSSPLGLGQGWAGLSTAPPAFQPLPVFPISSGWASFHFAPPYLTLNFSDVVWWGFICDQWPLLGIFLILLPTPSPVVATTLGCKAPRSFLRTHTERIQAPKDLTSLGRLLKDCQKAEGVGGPQLGSADGSHKVRDFSALQRRISCQVELFCKRTAISGSSETPVPRGV